MLAKPVCIIYTQNATKATITKITIINRNFNICSIFIFTYWCANRLIIPAVEGPVAHTYRFYSKTYSPYTNLKIREIRKKKKYILTLSD